MAAKRKKKATVSGAGLRIFGKPGTKNRVAVNLDQASVIEEDGAGKYLIEVNGVRHAIVSDDTLEDLAAGAPADETAADA